jgi:UDP-N-acetylmuramate--alanine ligase
LFNDFCTAFHNADILVLTEIYPASETPIPGVTAENLAAGIKEHGQRQVFLADKVEDLSDLVLPMLEMGDIVVTLGAGDIWRAGEQIVLQLSEKETEG